ncbi:MAG: hypothetical protein AAGJ55_12595, partial [Cyanobacteria bacterium J06555_12]
MSQIEGPIMKAIGYIDAGVIAAENALIEFETEIPQLGPNDLLVDVQGISVNPVDVKLRAVGPWRVIWRNL